MGIKLLKHGLSVVLVMTVLAGCSSTQEVPEPQVQEPVTDTIDDSTGVDNNPSVNVSDGMDLPTLDTVFYFEFDQAVLLAEARAALTAHAERLKAEPRSIRIEGHADERGSREYNMALGERRANAVRDFLVLQGVGSSSIETVSYGEEYPAVVGSYDSAWEQNRRVELK